MRILIVEDNEGDQVLLREAFGQMDGQVRLAFATTVQQAASILKKDPVEMILLDLNLPGKNGKDFLRELKVNNGYKKIPVVVLTSSNADQDISESYALGASGYLIKPSDFSELEGLAEAICRFWGKVTFAKAH